MPRLRSKYYNHLNITAEPIDIEDQEDIIKEFKTIHSSQFKSFIKIFQILYLMPLPLYIFNPVCLKSPISSLGCILSILGSIINIQYGDHQYYDTFSDRLVRQLFSWVLINGWVLHLWNNGIALLVLFIKWGKIQQSDWSYLIFLMPLIISISSSFIKASLINDDITQELDKLENLKYKFKSI